MGRDTRSLIHQRAANCAVELRFEIDGQVWEAVRNLRRVGQAQHALYRYESDDAGEPVEKILQERPMAERVEELLGLDYAAFSRSVLLAQGEFDRFLRADASERDKVLKGVFGLDRIDRIRDLAKTKSKEGAHQLELISLQLQQVEAVRAELPDQRSRLLDLGERIAHLEKAEPTLADFEQRRAAAELARSAAIERLGELERIGASLPRAGDLETLEESALATAADRAAKAQLIEDAHRLVEEAEAALKEPGFATLVASIDQARDLMVRLGEARKSRAEVASRLEEESKRAASARSRAAEAEETRIRADAGLAAATEALEADRAAAARVEALAHAARHADMAATLRRGLEVGDSCPVCGQAVLELAVASVGGRLDDAETASSEARAQLDRSIDRHTASVAEQKAALQAEEERAGQVKEAEARIARGESEMASAATVVSQVEADISQLLGDGDPDAVLASLRAESEARGRAADEARSKREEARRQHDLAIDAEQQGAKALSEARSRLAVLAAGLKVEDPSSDVSATALASLLRKEWELQSAAAKAKENEAVAIIESARTGSSRVLDELGIEQGGFERAMAEARAASAMLERQVIAAEALIEGSEADLSRQAALLAETQLLQRVATDLTDARFVRFLLDEERRNLAGIGSQHFERLSSGRYRFTDDGDFMVVDQSSADSVRRADSLSGGETFLASLGLALGLAEMVGREGGRLDAFFLDEGFGTLDAEHLDLAMEGIEELVNDRRLVVVVSHVEGVRSRIDDLIVLDRDGLTGDSIVRAGAIPG